VVKQKYICRPTVTFHNPRKAMGFFTIHGMRTSATNYEAVKHIIKNNYQNDKQHHLINKKIQKDLRHVSRTCVSSLYEAVIA
jgi:hypothetical protein